MIADGHGTHLERRLSRLPRERDRQLIPFLCFLAVVYLGSVPSSTHGIVISAISVVVVSTWCRKCIRSDPRQCYDRATFPSSSSAAQSSPVINVSGAKSPVFCQSPLPFESVPVPIMLGVTVTPSGMPRKFNTSVVVHRIDRARKTFHELDGGYCLVHRPLGPHTAGRLPRLP